MDTLSKKYNPEQIRFLKFLSWKQKINQRKLKYLNFVSVLSDQIENLCYIGSQNQKIGHIQSLSELRNMIMLKVVKFDAAIESVRNDPVIKAAIANLETAMSALMKQTSNSNSLQVKNNED